jgi:DNA topoisomerase-1
VLQRIGGAGSAAEAKRNIARAIEEVAGQLGNTSAVCRKCYVHPTVLECYFDGTLADSLRGRLESGVIALLEQRQKRDADAARRSGANGESLAPLLARSISSRKPGRRARDGRWLRYPAKKRAPAAAARAPDV